MHGQKKHQILNYCPNFDSVYLNINASKIKHYFIHWPTTDVQVYF